MRVYNAGETIKRKRGRSFEVSTLLGQHSQRKQFRTTFFTNWLRGSPQKVVGLKKMGPTCCPTTRNTRINPRLDVPVKYEAPTVLQFWIISVVLQSSEVEMLENFSRFW